MQDDKEKFKKEFIKRLICFSIKIIKYSDKLKEQKVSFSIINQLIRSSTSIGANVVEAKSSHSKRDYLKYFEIALKSANETKYWIFIIQEAYLTNKKVTEELLGEAKEIANILATSILTMKGRK
ncbi:four helix bundle protein [Patescibacteria group bacterium]